MSTTSYYVNSTSTSTSSAWHDYAYAEVEDLDLEGERRMSWKFHSKDMEAILRSGVIKKLGAVAVFAHRNSPAYSDRPGLDSYRVSHYYDDPIQGGYDNPVSMGAYNNAIVIDALEFMPSVMVRANLIKEALCVLDRKSTPSSSAIILAVTSKIVGELAKKDSCKKIDDDVVLINDKFNAFNGLKVFGLTQEDLIEAALISGAKYIDENPPIETDRSCIRIYLHRQG